MSMLELKNVRTSYGGLIALHGISLKVEEKESVTMVGSNGAGKTTTLRVITGLLPTEEGEIIFEGERIDVLPAHFIVEKGIACVPEGRRLFPFMSIEDNLLVGSFTPRAKKRRKEVIKKVFETFPVLRQRRAQLAGTLSGGEQQMLAVGRGLMSSPKLLMLDEPSLGLAPLLVKRTYEVIESVKGMGISILLVEQEIKRALAFAERGYVLENGRIIMEGPSKRLVENDMIRRAYLGL